MWGNGLSAPKGEDDNEDMSFSIRLEKGSKQVILDYGACKINLPTYMYIKIIKKDLFFP